MSCVVHSHSHILEKYVLQNIYKPTTIEKKNRKFSMHEQLNHIEHKVEHVLTNVAVKAKQLTDRKYSSERERASRIWKESVHRVYGKQL